MFTAKNEKELLEVLKIISEESVADAKMRLRESKDPYSKSFQERLSATPYTLKEIDEEPEEETKTAEKPDESPQQEPEKKEEVPENFGASIDSLQKNINALRAGKSLKDSTINNQLQIYYDKLSEDEREVLVLFLRELSRILSGAVTGDDAVDPSDPPPGLNVDIVSKDTESQPAQQKPQPSQQQTQSPEKRVTTGAPEDTSPPIRVNESQDYRNLRKKVRALFGK